jgi:peptidoglycan/xylan/chitin deacetylase (PgdA/CDA1 family)
VQTYYHSLAPFRDLFQTGAPILTYHKLGPRPNGVRLKGLYLSETLFTRQLGELHRAGFTTSTLSEVLSPVKNSPRRITITFDDGFRNVLHFGLTPLRTFQFHAILFLVADLIGRTNEWEQRECEARELLMDQAQVREWLAAGHEIGSHTCTHPFLARLSTHRAGEEITASRKKIEDLFGVPVEHFCYPYGEWNETLRDLVADAGYKTACTTEPGVNGPADSRLALKRFTARYPSRNLKVIWSRLRRRNRSKV